MIGCMPTMSHALHFRILTVAGWLQRRQQAQFDYLMAENAIYKKRLGRAGLRLTAGQRRQLAIASSFLRQRSHVDRLLAVGTDGPAA